MGEKMKTFEKAEWIQMAGLAILFGLFLITRLYLLDQIPYAISADEATAAYDSLNIGRYGVDRWLIKMPVYFQGFGGGQSPMLIYLGALLFHFTPFSLLKFRMIPVFFATIAFFCSFFTGRLVFSGGSVLEPLIPPALFTVFPEFLMSERWGLDCNLFLTFSVIMLFVLINAYLRQGVLAYALAGGVCGLTLYTYAVSYLIMPIFLLALFLCMMICKKISWKQTAAFGSPLIILALPLIMEQLVNMRILKPLQLFGMSYYPMPDFRGNSIRLSYIIPNIPGIMNLISHDRYAFNAIGKYGTVLYCSVPFLLLGIGICAARTVRLLKNKEFDFSVILTFYFISCLSVLICIHDVDISQSNGIFSTFLYFTAYGIVFACGKVRRAGILVFIVYIAFFISFLTYYFGDKGERFNRSIETGGWDLFVKADLPETVRMLDAMYDGTRTIYILSSDIKESKTDFMHLTLALYSEVSPYEYMEDGIREGNYRVEIPDELDMSGNTVYIIEDNLHHVTDYLRREGFLVDENSCEGFALVYQ